MYFIPEQLGVRSELVSEWISFFVQMNWMNDSMAPLMPQLIVLLLV